MLNGSSRWLSNDGERNEVTEEPDHEDGEGWEDHDGDEDEPQQQKSVGLRGAFTAEDKQRGMKALRQGSADSESGPKQRNRSASLGARAARSLSLKRGSKSARQASGDDGAADGQTEREWEDEERDTVAASAGQDGRGGSKSAGAGKKGSAWGTAAGLLGGRSGSGIGAAGHHSGTSTPDAGSDREDGAAPAKRPGQNRRGSAWGVVKQKLAKTPKQPKSKTGETLAGSELIAVGHKPC